MSRSKAKGTAAETAVVKALESAGVPARRVALAGAADQGDIHTATHAIEVKKAGRFGSMTPAAEWKIRNEALREANNAGLRAAWVIVPDGVGEKTLLDMAYGQCVICDQPGAIRRLGNLIMHLKNKGERDV